MIGIQINKVTDSANIEQLRIILRYVFDGKPTERLFEYIDSNCTTGEELCNSILKSPSESEPPFNSIDCRSQIIDAVADMRR